LITAVGRNEEGQRWFGGIAYSEGVQLRLT
jgi:hypothetical protein